MTATALAIAPVGLFPLGRVVLTPGAKEAFSASELGDALSRHAVGDWGDVAPEDADTNVFSLAHGCRIVSAYSYGDRRLWAITEADRSVTTLLLPEEY